MSVERLQLLLSPPADQLYSCLAARLVAECMRFSAHV